MPENPITPELAALAELMARKVHELVAGGLSEEEAIAAVREQWLEELRGRRCRHCGAFESEHGTLGWCDPILIRNLTLSSYAGPGSVRFEPELPGKGYHRFAGRPYGTCLVRGCGLPESDPIHHPAGRRTSSSSSSSSPHVRSGHYIEALEDEDERAEHELAELEAEAEREIAKRDGAE